MNAFSAQVAFPRSNLKIAAWSKSFSTPAIASRTFRAPSPFTRTFSGWRRCAGSTSPRGSQLVFFKAPGSEELIEITKFDESGPVVVGPDLTHLAFEVDDLDAFARHSAEKGYPLSDGPTETGSGSVIAFIDAPEGYEIELIQHAK